MRIHLKMLLPLLVLLLWGTAAKAQYDPDSPPEPGVYFTLATRCVPENAAYHLTPTYTYPFGTEVGVSAESRTGYRFLQWEDEDGNTISDQPTHYFNMPAKDLTLTARFVYDPDSPEEPSVPEFKSTSAITFVTSPKEAGYFYDGITGYTYSSFTQEYEVGETYRLEAIPHQYYAFVNWTRNGIVVGTDRIMDYTVPIGDHMLMANFEYAPDSPEEPGEPLSRRMLSVRSNPDGAANVWFYNHDGHGVVSDMIGEGTDVYIRNYPEPYWNFINWTDENGLVVSEDTEFYYTMPAHASTLTANFVYNYNPDSPGEPGTPNPDGSIAENMVLWPRMGMYDSTHVQILCETPGSTIHYTLDGSTPNVQSPVYTEPVFVPSNLLVKAIAYKEGMEDSPVVSYQVTVYKTGIPIFTFENLKLKITSSTPDAIIRYTTDFTDPNEESAVYTEPFEPEENCRIKAYASKEGLTDSPINIFVFRQADYTVPAPTFAMNEEGRFVIIPSVAGGTTRYTLDGTDPTLDSQVYTEPLRIDGNLTIKAYTVHPNYYDSPVGEYVIDIFKVADPSATYAGLALHLTSATEGAAIRYTLDGSVPTEEAALYSEPLRLTEDCKVTARGFMMNYEPSDTVSYTFVLLDHTAAAPVLTYDPEAQTVSIVCTTEDVVIRYTTDGTVPTETNGLLYTGPIAVEGNAVYTAVAFRSDLFPSEAATVNVGDRQVPTPTAVFADLRLTISCEDSTAEIHYTLDGSDPTAESPLYESPLALTEDCIVRFIALRDAYNPSETAEFEFVRAAYQVAAPELRYDEEEMAVSISCTTEDAEVRYTTDSTVPTETTGLLYTGPIGVDGNVTFTAVAFRSGLFPSEPSRLTISDRQAPTPSAVFADLRLTISCEDTAAEIHYTLNGSDPTAESPLYESPLALTEDCLVRFIALRDAYNPSEIGEFEFVRAAYQVAAPELRYDEEEMTVSITCMTDDAEIRYTTDRTVPTETTGTLYNGPVAVEGNATFIAVAFRSGLFPSEPDSLVISGHQVPTPSAYYSRHTVTIECGDPLAQIHYTLDGTQPTSASLLYKDPIPMTEDCTVRFYATRDGYGDSEEDSFTFTLSQWQEEGPEINADFRNRRIHFIHAAGDAVRVDIDGEVLTLQTPDSVEVNSGMKLLKAVAIARDEDTYDSEAIEWELPFHKTPRLSYDGHAVHYAPAADDAYADGSEGWVYVNRQLRKYGQPEGSMEMLELCSAAVNIRSDHAFRSDDAEMTIDYYNTGRVAGAREGHRLAEAFGGWGDSKEDYTYLRIKGGEVTREDLEFIATLPNLTTLHLTPHIMETAPCDSVLAGTRIETLYSVGYPEGMLKGMPRLTTVMWGLTGASMPNGRIAEAGNPNILLWTTDRALAPADARNVVVYDYIGEGFPTDPEGTGITGRAERVTLEAGHPFNAHMPFEAALVELTKEFSMPTVVGECAGWESLVLPFTAESIVHETVGRIVPFSEWTGVGDLRRPFWLYRTAGEDATATVNGWETASVIEAGVPYIISMPNSAEYNDAYNIPGKVTFKATGVTLGVDESLPQATRWTEGIWLQGTFMPVDETDIRSLNVSDKAGLDHLGSAFVADAEALPFGAYLAGSEMPQQIPVFGGWTGVLTPSADVSGILVETPAPGVIRVTSAADFRTAIVALDGAVIRMLTLRGGESLPAEGLTPGLYIVAGRKVMVR